MKASPYTAKTIKRFHEKVYPEPNSGCWLWGGNVTDRGYGRVYLNNKSIKAHRVSVEIHRNITLKKEDVICHKCNNTYCVNPDHLYIGTQSENMEQAYREGRMSGSIRLPRKIRQLTLEGEEVAIFDTIRGAAKKYGYNQGNISKVCLGIKKNMYGYKWEYIQD